MQREKLLRVQGPRSKGGCHPCKLKHVKCDEATPSCNRCLRAKRTCHYPNRSSNIPEAKFVVYTPPREPDLQVNLTQQDRRALSYFQNCITSQIAGPFRSQLWSIVVPQMIQYDAIVRQAVLALSAFHEGYMNSSATNGSSTDLALTRYARAQRQVIELSSPDDNFDSVLCACIIFSMCEGLRGEFEIATRHIMAGMKIIAGRSLSPHRFRSIFSSERDFLADVFLMLQNQAMEYNVNDFNKYLPQLQKHMGNIPDHFTNVEEALPYLHNLLNEVLELDEGADEYHEDFEWTASSVAPALQPRYDAVRARVDLWTQAITRLENSIDQGSQTGFLLLKIMSSTLEIDLHIFVHGESTYDDFIELNHQRLNLIETFLQLRSGNDDREIISEGASFTSSPEVVPILFEIAIRTLDDELHSRAIKILRACRRREGIWDGHMAASLAEKLIQLCCQGDKAARKLEPPHKFLITDIQLLSVSECRLQYGFKLIKPGTFESFWLETIRPGQGTVQSEVFKLS